MEINVSQFIDIIPEKEAALVGRDNGRAFRKKVEGSLGRLEQYDLSEKVIVNIPRSVVTMNKSFFLGAFADRSIALGKSVFLNTYDFSSSPFIDLKIESFVDYALKNSSMKDILNG